MRLRDRERAVRPATEHVRGAGRVVLQQLAEEHIAPWMVELVTLDKLSSDLLNIK
jgi:hypothetical protein